MWTFLNDETVGPMVLSVPDTTADEGLRFVDPMWRLFMCDPSAGFGPDVWLLLLYLLLPGQRLQAAVGSDGESSWQRERREDPVQPATSRAGEDIPQPPPSVCCSLCSTGSALLFMCFCVEVYNLCVQVEVIKKAYQQDSECEGAEVSPQEVGHNIYILAQQVI